MSNGSLFPIDIKSLIKKKKKDYQILFVIGFSFKNNTYELL